MCVLSGAGKKMSIAKQFAAGMLLLILSTFLVPGAVAQTTFSLEKRIACQTVIENIRWSHRLWPEENSSVKPQRSEILSDQQIRVKVEDSLRMEAALDGIYGIEITEAMLQAELDRMTGSTRAPGRLQELFGALGNDPVTIAECLVRPALVSKQLYNRYAKDDSQHAGLRLQAETALAINDDPVTLEASGGQERLVHLVRVDGNGQRVVTDVCEYVQCIELDSAEFDRETNRLLGASVLKELPTSFVYEKLLNRSDDFLEVQSFIWHKQNFNQWWSLESGEWVVDETQPATAISMALPVVTGGDEELIFSPPVAAFNSPVPVVADSWLPPPPFPEARALNTAVWTGSEMIIWGGQNTNGDTFYSGCWHYDPVSDHWQKVSPVGEPSGRILHTAIWTGTEMIVWGGGGNEGWRLQTGWRYNPGNSSVTATTTTVGAPTGRDSHTAVWSGSEMIIWGGNDGSGNYPQSGGRYNPATDSWSATTITGAPEGRPNHTAVWSGSEMLIWGGSVNSSSTWGSRYNPATDNWIAITTVDAPSLREKHTAVWTGDEMIIYGGRYYLNGTGYVSLNSGGLYDPVADSWTATSIIGAPSARTYNSNIWSGSEMLIWGGINATGSSYLNTGGRYDPVNDTWEPTTPTGAPSARGGQATVWSGSEMIIWGGGSNSGGCYDPATDTWSTMITSIWEPDGKSEGSSIWTGSEVIIYGGTFSNEGATYDPMTNTWEPITAAGAPTEERYRHSAVWTGTKMVIWGGNSSSGYLNNGAQYDPAANSWSAISSIGAPAARDSHTTVWSGSEMIIWGGYDGSSNHLNTGGRYNPVADSWSATTVSGAPVARRDHSAVWGDGEMIVWGGWIGNTEYQDGSRYNPVTDTWVTMTTTGAPSPRHFSTGVWTGSEMIIWGGEYWNGSSFSNLNSGGRYDPAADTWLPTTLTGAPAGRNAHTAVWSGREMIIWGGWSNSGGRYSPDTDSWLTTTTAGAPTLRAWHTAVWSGSEMIIWGGSGGYGVYYPYSSYAIGGIVSGLAVGESIILQNNGGDDLPMTEDGSFTFAETQIDGSNYDITVSVQPVPAERYCGIPQGSGTLVGASVNDIEVNCVTVSLEDVIAALQVLSGMTPSAGELASLTSIAPGGRITLTEVIMVLGTLAVE